MTDPVLVMLSFAVKDDAALSKLRQDCPAPVFSAVLKFKADPTKVAGYMGNFFLQELRRNPLFFRQYVTDKEAFDAELAKLQAERARLIAERRGKKVNKPDSNS